MKNYQNCEKITFLSLLRLGICLDNEGKVHNAISTYTHHYLLENRENGTKIPL